MRKEAAIPQKIAASPRPSNIRNHDEPNAFVLYHNPNEANNG